MVNNKKDISEFKGMVDAKRQHDVDREITKLKDEKNKIERKYKDLLDDHTALKNEYEIVQEINLDDVSPVIIEPSFNSRTPEGYYSINVSDMHCLERVLPDQVNGLNEFNSEICQESMNNLWVRSLDKLNSHRSKMAIPRIGINIMGDIITNQLHPDQKEMNQGTPMEEILFSLDIMSGGIDYLLNEADVEQIDINCCDGNHGRDNGDKRIQVANRVKHSYEWLLYKFLQKIYKDETRINFKIATAYHLYVKIFDKIVRIHHGDGIRYMGGSGGLTIPMNKAIQDWNTGKSADLDLFGHWHTTLTSGQFISNGSIIGFNPYSVWIKAKFEQPSQSGILFDKKLGITSIDKIYVR